MPQIVNVPADAIPTVDPTVDECQATFDAAQAALDKLVEKRRAKRDTMSKTAFRVYNEDTTDQQLDVHEAVDDAAKALARALRSAPGQTVTVGTATDSENAQGGNHG